MDSYMACLRKYADFSGRSRRKEFWTFALVNLVIFIAVIIFASTVGGGVNYNGGGGVSPAAEFLFFGLRLFCLAILVPYLAVQVRRLHDTGKSGWWWFIQLIPTIGGIWILILFLLDSQPGPNQWGPNPKESSVTVAATSSQ